MQGAELPDKTTENQGPQAPVPLGRLDAAAMTVGVGLLLLLSFLRSRNTIFWSDEIMGWLVLHERTLHGFLHNWQAGADSSGLFFYLFAIPWLHLFGDREIALRLFSAAGVGTAFGLTWALARRFYRFETVLACLPLTLLTSNSVLWQLVNGRSYGVLLAAVALVAYAFVLVTPGRRVGGRLLLLTFFAHLLLVGSHILGPLYSVVFVAGLLAQDLWFRVRRPALYGSAAAAWLLVLFSWPNLRATADLGKPAFWTVRPHWRALIVGACSYSDQIKHALELLVLVVLVATLSRTPDDRPASLLPRERLPLYFVLASFFAGELLIFGISRVTTSIFVDRYLLPMVLADALLFCELLSRCKALLRVRPWLWHGLTALALLKTVSLGATLARDRTGYPQAPYLAALVGRLPAAMPVISTSVATFVEGNHYEHDHVDLLTPIDWPIALEGAAHGVSVSGAHEMDTWKRLGYYADRVQPTADLLARYPEFVVITEAGDRLWLDRRVRANPRYSVRYLGRFEAPVASLDLWQVETNR